MDRLTADEVQVWCLRPEALPAGAAELLDAAERAQVERLVFERDRRLQVAAHALLRIALSSAAGGTAPQDWCFRRRPEGKPELAPGCSGPVFNLTHTEGLAACALQQEGEVGIDAEHGRDGTAPLEVAETVFTGHERHWLAGLPAAERGAAFFDLWTLKEAYMKARGLGFLLPPAGLEAKVSPPSVQDRHPAPWRFALLRPTAEHHLAVAATGHPPPRRLRWRELTGAWRETPLATPPAA